MKNTIVIIAAAVIFTGCSVHKAHIKEPLIEMPAAFSEQSGQTSYSGRWWKQFGDEKLDYLMEEVFKHNLDIVQAYERLQLSVSILKKTGAARLPIVNIEGSGGRTRQAGAFGASTSDAYSVAAKASYEIDLWKKVDSSTKAARFDMLASEQNLKALYISISAQVAELYFQAVEQRAQLALSDKTIASFQDTLARVERRYKEGLVPSIDLYQSRQNLAAAKARRPVFASNLAVTLNAMSVLAGRFPDKEIGGTKMVLENAPDIQTGLPSQLLMNRPDIRSSLMKLKAGNERISTAVADRFPSFNLVGSYGGASDEVGTILDSPNIIWNALLQIAQPIFDGQRRKAEVDRAEAEFRGQLAEYHTSVLIAFREVEDSLARINASKERIAMLHDQVNASRNSHRLALERYTQGLSDYLPVLTEQLGLFNAESSLLQAKKQLVSDNIQLARSLGGEWVDEIHKK
jgi:NodT family efflux transporter outer membrane factor (OMF) lipoprotein